MSKKKGSPLQKARRIGITIAILVVLVLCGVAGAGVYLLSPPQATGRPVLVHIKPGSTIWDVAQDLQRHGIIRSANVFFLYTHLLGKSRRIRAGYYRLSSSMSAAQVLFQLASGKHMAGIWVTIPEGFTAWQIANLLQKRGVVVAKPFLSVVHKPEGIIHADFPFPKTGLEGYLFPDTYLFDPKSSPSVVIQRMINDFERRFADPYRAELQKDPIGLWGVTTVASMIEREAKAERDRPRIAAVIYNRLKIGMPLQIDASVLYAMNHHTTQISTNDLKTASPYNTYLHTGLPPGPISNPGLQSLLAALHPDHDSYLYYVAAPNGTQIFATTLAQHEHNIRLVQQEESSVGRHPVAQ
ncbi:MAG: endolytic transglycosylase MltG [Armatimonadetes bacterium]|nr:endolytic transglycosylase MltG [Armatimonadota bacterium]